MDMEASQPTRRDFLGQAARVGAILGYPYVVPSTALSSERQPGANGRIVLGIVGMGQRGNQLLANIPASGQVAAICDVDSRRTAAALKQHHASWKVYQDYRQMFEQPDLDAVIICTVDHHHVQASMLACQAGKDVYCEKPLSVYLREGRASLAPHESTNALCKPERSNEPWK